MLTGVTANTIQRMQLGAGVVCTGYTAGGEISGILGATRGGGSFTAVPTARQIAADGMPQYVKGMEVIDDWVATLNATLIETTEVAIKKALGYSESATVGSITTITPKQGLIPTTEYGDLYWIGNTSDGNFAIIKLSDAMNSNGFNLTFTDKGEGTFALAAIAHYDISALSTVPFTVTLDKTVSSPSAIALSSIDPTDGSSGAVSAVVLTFNNAIESDNVFVTLASSGAVIAGTKVYDGAHKILTFTPTVAFASALHIVNIVGVRDIYGQALATETTTFTVA